MQQYLEALRSKRNAVQSEIAEIRTEISTMTERLTIKEAQLRNLDQLIELENGAQVPDPGTTVGTFVDLAHEILSAGGPLHYRDLADAVSLRGVHIPGRNPAANLLAHLARDARFVRTARGTYGVRGAHRVSTVRRPTRRRRLSKGGRQ